MPYRDDLKKIRSSIDTIDNDIINLLHKRFIHTQQIGQIKKTHHLEITDLERENKIHTRLNKLAENKLNKNFVKEIVEVIIKHSREIQKESPLK